jgi:hypothetical protein
VIDAAYSRTATVSSMDAYDHRALDDCLRDLEPLMTWHEGGPIRYSDVEDAGEGGPMLTSTAASRNESAVDPFDRG